jgi:hypothetical protein
MKKIILGEHMAHLVSLTVYEEFEDTKGVIRIRISQKYRQHNGQGKVTKGQTTIYKAF